MSDFMRKSGAALFLLASILAGSANAEAGRRVQSATMSLGAPAAAPSGFLEFCRREPAQCRPAQPETFDANAVARQATSLYWENVFAHQAGARTPALTATITTPWSSRRPVRIGRDWKSVSSRRELPTLPGSSANEGAVSADLSFQTVRSADVVTLDRANWRLLNTVNRDVNRRIRQVSDEQAFGKVDYWQAPTQDGAAGDCEDFVLAKREALIKAGIPATALSIAVVETRWGETHAVLLVAGDTGEYVLDNLSSWISRWDRVGYTWRQRQAPRKTFEWVNVAA